MPDLFVEEILAKALSKWQKPLGSPRYFGQKTFRFFVRSFILSGRYGSLVIACLLVLSCPACIPLRFTTSPGANGQILDAKTHAPVIGAEVVISRSTYPPSSPESAFSNSRSPKVMSGQDGSFSVPLERRMDLYFVPIDAFPRFGLLVIKREGYPTTCIPFWSHSVADLGQIRLEAERH
ncbi:MAG TPA: hypothetical protein VL793_09880 [Patescibacteria group bacterium]|nr:hypothetical protein [Patescibacteria group bacterium]